MPEENPLETTSHELDVLIRMFTRETGRSPGLQDIMMMREAIASVALDKGDVGTYSLDELDTVEVGGEGGAFTAHHPPGDKPGARPTYTEEEVEEVRRAAYEKGRADERAGRE
jgi:hypothetical protein